MKTLLPVATALALVAAVNPSSAIARGSKPRASRPEHRRRKKSRSNPDCGTSSPIWLPAAACQRASACPCR
jgi:hypothetical protein